ncbi:MAG TPA: 4-(cytidine 5'-diphospho)-2-C-methyl-D-erythritol kinase [Bacteroides sp.]|nr:4-(cytidine 5'-diphospho)-2-C-methyl-D-erythritol kinase [Phocaeicola coprophilus]HBB07074.1 4-(cytidine 5'-diphospho)-2-C-methyl-D-erythritol kinase [Bacteroides sp.]
MITFPNAKINLGLRITERRPDGYHNLETIFYPIHLEDALEVVPLKDNKQEYDLKITGTPIDGTPEDNLVVRAYRLLKQDFDLPPIHIYMYKHIPLGAGLGGGSSDAAFMIKLLNEKFALGMTTGQMEAYASRLGADCAFFIQDRPVLATGIGNEFTPIDLSLKGMYIVLVKPSVSVSTREAYAGVTPQRPDVPLTTLIRRPIEEWRDCIANDFEPSVFRAYPEIAAIKDKLYDMGAVYASMSGSGSTVYGIFRESVPYVDEHFGEHFCRIRELE